MDVCETCGQKLNRYTRFCTNCNTRLKKAKKKSGIKSKRIVVGVGSIIGLLLVFDVFYFIIKNHHNHEPSTNAAVRKTIVQPKNNPQKNTRKTDNENNSSQTTGSENKTPSPSTYILPDSDKKFLSEGDIASLTKEQLRLARNEIYARHGYVFKSADLQTYFSSKPWYHANPAYHNSLSKIELKNAQLLSARENQM